ncbi:MAG TPA: hypothetical protein VFZ09_46195 [Archangium sp.]|uniref:hypothetical protein n=1 Tax=Archangium sp. TaxID=1872627 RepID=UPI002E339A82|nr:hypothetical protein [Archangium sp.]HEX5753669.1 hypothetical protein [Archangium sp.]
MYFDLKRITKNQEYRWEVVEQRPSGSPSWKDAAGNEYWAGDKMYRIAFIGHGSTVAYYLTALAQASVSGKVSKKDLYERMVVFGSVDPWDRTVRGDGYINHERHQISHWGKKVPQYSQEYMQRSAFAEENAKAFENAFSQGATLVTNEVVSIEKLGDVFRINTRQGSYSAAFVVVATGLGAHRGLGDSICPKVPKDDREDMTVSQMKDALRGKVVNLDEFMTLFPETSRIRGNTRHRETPVQKLTVAVHGTNAGIDAAQRAWQLGHKVMWIWGNGTPIFLPGHRLPIEKPQTDIDIKKIGRKPVTVEPQGNRVLIKTHEQSQSPETLGEVDVYVISLGQDPFATGCAGDLLITQGNMEVSDFEPMYDWNQHFGMPFQTVLGFQTKGTRMGLGLQIIGGVTESLAKDLQKRFAVQHNYKDQLGPAELKPTRESCQAQLDRSPSMKKKHGTAENLLKEKLPNWERAQRHRDSHLKLSAEYLGASSMIQLLTHQVDPKEVPQGLQEMLKKYNYKEMDWFQKWQVATPERPSGSAVASVLLPSQLGAVRAVVAALNTMIPDYVSGGDANYNTDDRTMLAVYIAENFPNLSPEEANARVEAIIDLRRREYTPLGFYDDDTRKLTQERMRQQK